MTRLQAIFERMVEREVGAFPPALANLVLSLKFSAEEQGRYLDLSYRAQDGGLSADEQAELDDLLAAETFLVVLKSEARRTLKTGAPAA